MKVNEIKIVYKTNKNPISNQPQINSSENCFNIFSNVYDLDCLEHKEFFYCMYLNRQNRLLGVLKIREGGINSCVVDIRCIFQGALKLNARAIIVSHNHPSGNLQPSESDKNMTEKIQKACKIMDIEFLDHIILTASNYYSFADNGNL